MRTSKYEKPLSLLLTRPLFTADEARKEGVPSRMLSFFCQKGVIERAGRGIYRVAEVSTDIDPSFEELVLTALSIPHGVICLISALCYYQMTDQIIREYWIAVPNKDKSPKRPHIRVIRMRNMLLGQTSERVGKFKIKIFDRERTVIDAFRYLSHEIAIKALQTYLNSTSTHKPSLQKLSEYAKILRTNITPYIMALTT